MTVLVEDKHDLAEKKDPANHHHVAEDVNGGQTSNAAGGLHRRLGNRQLQLVTIGGSIGTGLFVPLVVDFRRVDQQVS